MQEFYSLFSKVVLWTALKWLLVALIWGVLIYNLYKEYRLIHTRRIEDGDSQVHHLLRAQHHRNLLVAILITLVLLMDLSSDLRQETPHELPDISATAPDTAPTQNPVAAAATTPATRSQAAASLPFTDITEFNEKNSKEQAYLDALKQRYEAWLVTFYYLQQCHYATKQDFELIRGALAKELEQNHAGKPQEDNIISAAIGSYQEMYHDIPCDSAHMDSTRASYDANMQQLRSESRATANPAVSKAP